MPQIEVKFVPKDRVIIDEDKDLIAIVTAINIHPDSAPQYAIEWFDAGSAKLLTLDEFRLSPAPSN